MLVLHRANQFALHAALVLAFATTAPAFAMAQTPEPQRAVLVTGASSGIGHKITERLSEKGFFVYAGARAQRDLDALNAMKNVQAVRLDVTIPADIANAVATVTRGVNPLGPIRITRAFAPLLFESKGRVVNTVVKGSRFEAQARATIKSMGGFATNPPPDDVADAVFDAFSNSNPRLRYLVVPVASQAAIVIRKLMDEIAPMNDSQKFTYDRETPVRMLDEALARAKQGK